MKISLFASSVRPQLYPAFFKSLESEPLKNDIEVVFAGNANGLLPKDEWRSFYLNDNTNDKAVKLLSNVNVFYIPTANIKPSQCYEIARRNCTGEVVVWVADDCEFIGGILSKAYEYWKSKNNRKLILSIQTKESGYNLPVGQLFDMDVHRFFGGRGSTPLMAPLGMMSREYLDELGGIDRRYVCGQYENDIVMRAYADGGSVEIFGDKDAYIDIDHLGKSIQIGESDNETDFLHRPFAKGYHKDRSILESSWAKDGQVSLKRFDEFEPFEDQDLLTKSQSNKGHWS